MPLSFSGRSMAVKDFSLHIKSVNVVGFENVCLQWTPVCRRIGGISGVAHDSPYYILQRFGPKFNRLSETQQTQVCLLVKSLVRSAADRVWEFVDAHKGRRKSCKMTSLSRAMGWGGSTPAPPKGTFQAGLTLPRPWSRTFAWCCGGRSLEGGPWNRRQLLTTNWEVHEQAARRPSSVFCPG